MSLGRELADGIRGDQLTNAALIMNAAIDMGLGRNAQVLGVITAMGESSLVNIGQSRLFVDDGLWAAEWGRAETPPLSTGNRRSDR